ncbi:MAG TPA: CinA family protein, partial [Desulfobacterales bacterium]|nr:CinA family protein [Desulfobacterales bacterium]
TLALAESCTGGLVGHRITNLSGSSEYFQGSVVCYSNRAKEDLLGVRPQTLERYGAVSDQTAQEMAVGVREALKADLAVAITGIAGPTGGSKEKPVGTVYFGLSNSKGVISQSYRFLGSRREVKAQAATMALDWVRRYVTNTPLLPSI